MKISSPLNSAITLILLLWVLPSVSQTTLTVRQRMENVRGAFKCRPSELPARLLLVDDVLTTGATANACAKELKANGSSKVYVITLVRAES